MDIYFKYIQKNVMCNKNWLLLIFFLVFLVNININNTVSVILKTNK